MCYETEKTLEAGRYFLGMQAGLGTRNIAHGLEITTVCYEIEKPSRREDIFEGEPHGAQCTVRMCA